MKIAGAKSPRFQGCSRPRISTLITRRSRATQTSRVRVSARAMPAANSVNISAKLRAYSALAGVVTRIFISALFSQSDLRSLVPTHMDSTNEPVNAGHPSLAAGGPARAGTTGASARRHQQARGYVMLCNPTGLPSVSLKMAMKPCSPMEVRGFNSEPPAGGIRFNTPSRSPSTFR